eukprot:GHRR01020310.1.p1 GENE.GHRR01020310.1~~GHRR01020310.1.p1  ORF type:complete len:152 (+),score=0.48 GHRR01020310.1:641-1096(+)
MIALNAPAMFQALIAIDRSTCNCRCLLTEQRPVAVTAQSTQLRTMFRLVREHQTLTSCPAGTCAGTRVTRPSLVALPGATAVASTSQTSNIILCCGCVYITACRPCMLTRFVSPQAVYACIDTVVVERVFLHLPSELLPAVGISVIIKRGP